MLQKCFNILATSLTAYHYFGIKQNYLQIYIYVKFLDTSAKPFFSYVKIEKKGNEKISKYMQ